MCPVGNRTTRLLPGECILNLEHIAERLAQSARQIVQADAAVVRLLDENESAGERSLSLAAAVGVPKTDLPATVPLADSPLDQAALAGDIPLWTDAHLLPPFDAYRSAICLPLAEGETVVGTLQVYAAPSGGFDSQTIATLTPLAALGAVAISAVQALRTQGELEAEKAHFIHVATHELRSPVAVAQSLLRGVLKGYAGELTPQQRELFGRISRRLDLLEQLVNDLLDLAAGQTSHGMGEETAVIVNASVGRAVLLLLPRAEEKGIELVYQACCDELVAWGTEEGLDRIFVNLLSNAIKYTPSGGRVEVTLRSIEENSEEEIEVRVTDTGIGIPPEAMPHLFETFYRAPNAKALNEVGTGLGLSIVKDLVERYGARIEVESTVGKGTTFTVIFPVYAHS